MSVIRWKFRVYKITWYSLVKKKKRSHANPGLKKSQNYITFHSLFFSLSKYSRSKMNALKNPRFAYKSQSQIRNIVVVTIIINFIFIIIISHYDNCGILNFKHHKKTNYKNCISLLLELNWNSLELKLLLRKKLSSLKQSPDWPKKKSSSRQKS